MLWSIKILTQSTKNKCGCVSVNTSKYTKIKLKVFRKYFFTFGLWITFNIYIRTEFSWIKRDFFFAFIFSFSSTYGAHQGFSLTFKHHSCYLCYFWIDSIRYSIAILFIFRVFWDERVQRNICFHISFCSRSVAWSPLPKSANKLSQCTACL